MFRMSNPRWTQLLAAMLFLAAALTSTSALAGNTHSEGGAVVEAPGVPETDGTASVQIYWTGDSAARTSVVTGTPLAGYWLHDAGFALSRQWLVGDEHVATLEFETGAGTTAHTGYYGASTKLLTSLDPDEFPAMTVRPIPVPLANAGPGYIDLAWSPATVAGSSSAIAGYNLYRSTDGIAFTKLNSAALADTTYRDSSTSFGTTYQYALGLVYAGTPALDGAIRSANSTPVTPADATPPDAPVIAVEPAFTPGASNIITWSSEAASGATEYYAECALDADFTSLVGNSGWKPDSTHAFEGLADGLTYFYRVRARDVAANASTFSAPATSRQDASAPSSQLQTLTAFKSSSTVNLEWAASDSISGVASVQLYWSKDGGSYTLYPGGPFTTSPIAFDASTTGGDGTYAFYTLATDAVANAEAAPETPDATTIVDTQPPASPAIAALPSFTPGDARAVSWSSQAATGAVSYRIQASLTDDFAVIALDSAWLADSTHTFTGLADGSRYAYRAQSRDEAGNESAWSTLAASTQDASAPATAAEALPAQSNTPAFDIAWQGSDATSGLAAVELYWSKDGVAFALLAGGPWTTSPIAFDAAAHGGDGAYAFYTIGTDAVGNAETAPATPDAAITIDTAAPEAPVIAALPTFTAGTERMISWDGGAGAAFLAQAARDAEFTTLVAESGWITSATHTFTGLADGQAFFYRVRSRDAVGNESAFSDALTSIQDASAPATAADALPAITPTTAFDVAWAGSDAASGLASVELWYSKDGGAYQQYAGGPFAASPIAFDAATTGGDGDYTFYTRGTDAVGNREAAPAAADAQTAIDTAAPGAPTIAGLQTFTPSTSLHIAWSDESASGAAEYQAELAPDATFTSIDASSGWITGLTHDFTGLSDGQQYWIRVQARDAAQNTTGYSGIQSTTLDVTPPAANIEALAASGNDATLDLAWQGTDATSGIQNVDVYWSKNGSAFALLAGSPFDATPIAFDASALGDGQYSFYVRARDRAGNLEAAPASPDATTLLDTTAPGAPVLAALPAFTAGTSRAVSWSDQSASGASAYLAQASTAADFSSIAFESGWITGLSHAFNGLSDGQTYHYRVRSRDAIGNESLFAAALQSTQDATPPQTAVAALPALSASANLALAWTGSDATSGIASVDLFWSKDGSPYEQLAGGPFTTSPIPFDATLHGGDGIYSFYTVAQDAVGNAEPEPTSADAVTRLDTAAPNTPVLASLPGFTAGSVVSASWNDLGAGTTYRAQMSETDDFAMILQDTGWISATSFQFTGLTNARTYRFRVQARDAAANASGFSALAATTMDAVRPTSQLDPLPALVNTSNLQLEWSGYDLTSGIAGVDLYYSRNGAAFTLHPASPFTASPIPFDATLVGGDGQYAFYVRARDGAGNYEDAPAAPGAQTRIDTTPPQSPVITALPAFSPGSSLLLAWSNQSASGATEYLAEMSMAPNFATLAATTGWVSATSWNFLSLDDGTTYWFRVKSRDAALNESAPAAIQSTTLDDTPPASAVSALAPVMTTLSFPVSWTGADATSGVSSVDLYYARDGGAYTLYPGGPFASSPIAFDASTVGGQGSYAYYTRARDQVGNREPAPAGPDAQTTVSTTAVGSPTIAALPTFTPGTSRTLAWTPGGNNTTYYAQAASDAGFANIVGQSGWTTSTSHTFSGLTNGATYWYRVKGRNAVGVEGPYSLAATSTQDATAPQSQVAAQPALQSTHLLSIAWTASDATSGIAGVRLYASRNGGAYAEYAGGPYTSSPIAFDASTLGGDGTYAFYTRAIDGAGNVEAPAASADASTTLDTAAPLAPTLLAEPSATQGTSNTVTWNPASGAAEYEIECGSDALFSIIVDSSGWITSTSYTFTGLQLDTTYYYRARARDNAGNTGAWSAAVASTQSAGYVLGQGWNLISFNVEPTDRRIDQVLASIAGSYTIVRTYDRGTFETYLPTLPVDMNDLQEMDALHGYWLYMTRPDTLLVGGSPMSSATPITLQSGWNLAGYLPSSPRTPSTALASIAASLAVARGYEPGAGYQSWYPNVPTLSDMAEMRTGHGYWMYMTSPEVLVYGGLPKAAAEPTAHPLPITARSDAASVPTVMDLYSTKFTIEGEPAPEGTIVEAVDAAGRTIATLTVQQAGRLPILHLLGDVSVTEADEGLVEGETFSLRIPDRDLVLVGGAELSWQASQAQELELEFVSSESLLPKAFALGQNAPNPFNPTTTIAYAIPLHVDGQKIDATQVDLRIFDIRGRVVRTLVTERQAPGRYSVVWNGRDDQGRSVSTGVYFYRLHTEEFTQSHKMMLVK